MAIIAVDFDGTCVDHEYPFMGKDVPDAVRVLTALTKRGHQLMLWTMRAEGGDYDGKTLEDAVSWFEHHKIPLWGVNLNPEQGWSKSKKQYANYYIDDTAVGAPLKEYPGFRRPAIDWLAIEEYFQEKGGL